MNKVFILLSIIVMASCNEELTPVTPYIDPTIKPYVEIFQQEGHARGIDVDISDIRVVFADLDGASGEAFPDRKLLYIDSTTSTWYRYPEALVLHELGHLLLNRGHDNSWIYGSNGNRFVKSIMNTSMMPFWKDRSYFMREYYVDELFDPSTSEPDWAFD